MTEQTLYFRITAATPLHVGCDEVYEPTSFVLDADARELVSFETTSFLELLDSDALEKFSTICRKGTIVSLLELLRFMRDHAELADGRRVTVPQPFIDHYEETLRLPPQERRVQQELNNFKIMRTAFDPLTNTAYLPGSAIKGAIRTAVLNSRHRRRPRPAKQYEFMKPGDIAREARNLEKQLTGGAFETDPFRLLKVSDFFPISQSKCSVAYAIDRKKTPSKFESQAPYQILETVDPGVEFVGSISLLPLPGRGADIKEPLTWDEIFKSLSTFFGYEKQREDQELAVISIKSVELSSGTQSFPLRIGRHSGAESVTITGHRCIKIMQGKGNPPKTLDHATTVWLSASEKKPSANGGLLPFGWTTFQRLNWAEGVELFGAAKAHKDGIIEKQSNKASERKRREEELAHAQAARQQEEEKKKAREAAEEEARIAAEKRENEALAAMSEAERQAHLIRKDGTPENEIVDIYNRLDQFELADRKLIAEALKSYWQLHDKWNVKKKQIKQWDKVNKVKAILEAS